MTNPKLPVQSLNRDIQRLAKQIRNYGPLTQDPTDPNDGWVWIRKDLAPPELRVSLDGTVFSVQLT
jgi:hypothetical protein